MLNLLPGRIINLHISYLPWNKGKHPNFWSFFEDTPKGVSIHQIDKNIDTGDIILQKIIDFGDLDLHTLASTYHQLQEEIQTLFKNNWDKILNDQITALSQQAIGSYHVAADIEPHFKMLDKGWDSSIKNLLAYRNQIL